MALSRFDLVVIKDVHNVKYLSGPKSRPAKPGGAWVVTYVFTDGTVLISKDETLVRIPVDDVEMVGKYDLNKTIGQINQAGPRPRGEKDGQGKGSQGTKERPKRTDDGAGHHGDPERVR